MPWSLPDLDDDASKALPYVALIGLVSVFLAPSLFLGEVFYLKDALHWFYPSRLYWRSRVLDGDFPLWIPELDMGSPFLADPGNSALYPLNVILFLPAPACVGQFLVMHVILAALGTFALLCALDVRPVAAFTGAVGYALGGYILSMTWSGLYLLSVAWMPLVAYLSVRVMRFGRLRDVVFLGLAIGCQILSGEVQGVAFTALVVFTLLFAEVCAWRRRVVTMLRVAGAALIALGLASPQVLPTLDLLGTSVRAGGIPLEVAQHWSFHPLRLLELVVPWLFGDPSNFQEHYLGYFMQSEGGDLRRFPWMLTPYFGSVSIVLALMGMVFARSQHRRLTLAMVSVGVLALLLALGRHTPVFRLFFVHTPGASLFRYPEKYWAIVAFVAPCLAAVGLDAWIGAIEGGQRRPIRAMGAAVASIFLALAVGAVLASWAGRALAALNTGFEAEYAASWVRWTVVREGVVFGALCLLVWSMWRWKPALTGHAVAAALVLQIAVQNSDVARTMEAGVYERVPPLAEAITASKANGGVPRVWRHTTPLVSSGGIDVDYAEYAYLVSDTLSMNTGIIHGIGYAAAYTASDTLSRARFWRATDDIQKPVMDLFSIEYVIAYRDVPVPQGIGLEHVASSTFRTDLLYRNTRALPMCRSVGRAVFVSTYQQQIEELHAPGVLYGRSVVLDGSETLPGSNEPDGPFVPCQMERPTRNTIRARCELEVPGWIVVNEAYHHNWIASLDGAEARVLRANAIVMAVAAPRGRHVLELSYRESSLWVGLAAAGGTLLFCALVLFRFRQRRKAYILRGNDET
jgi:hypothetical protein